MIPDTWKKVIAIGAGAVIGNLAINTIYQEEQTNAVLRKAREYAESVGKPVLDFGCGTAPRGDVNMDIVPRDVPNFLPMPPDSQRLPFEDKHFGAALAFHVLEHVNDPEHVKRELERVADKVFIITPHPLFLLTWLHPGHKWVFVHEDTYFRNPLVG